MKPNLFNLRALALLLLFPGSALAYPLYWIGTQVRGSQFVWSYSGLNSDGAAWSNANTTAESARAAIAASYQDFNAGAPKDAAGHACSTLVLIENTPRGGTQTRLSSGDGVNSAAPA